MKSNIKKVLIFCLLVLMACGGDSDDITNQDSDNITDSGNNEQEPDANNYKSGVLKIEGVSDFNLSGIKVVSPDAEVVPDSNGNFKVDFEPDEVEELPILVTKGEDLVFGYFSSTSNITEFKLDDILVFFLMINPRTSGIGLTKVQLKEKLLVDSNYESLKSRLTTVLQESKSPLVDNDFIDLLMLTAASIIESDVSSKSNLTNKSITKTDEFEVNLKRDGAVEWEKQGPSYASLGMAIYKLETGEIVSGPHFLDPKNVILSPISMAYWLYGRYFEEESKTDSFQITDEGIYAIGITNGYSAIDFFEELKSETRYYNAKLLTIKVISVALPFGLKKFLKDPKCREELAEFINNEVEILLSYVALGKKPSDIDRIKLTKDAVVNILALIRKCADLKLSKFLTFIAKSVDILAKVESTAEIGFLIGEFFNSNVKGQQLQFYYDGVSHGKLYNNFLTNKSFSGPLGTELLFETQVFEEFMSYKIERTNTGFPLYANSMTFNAKEELEGANGLPFKAEVLDGDAILVNGVDYETSGNGNLMVHLEMGSVDSKIKLTPEFKATGLNNEEIIYLSTLNYLLRFGFYNWNNDFNNVEIYKNLEKVSSLTLPNYTGQFVSPYLKDEPIENYNGLNWNYLEDIGSEPSSGEDIHIPNYKLTLYDYWNTRNVDFYFDLTLSNLAYRSLIEKELTYITEYGGEDRQFKLILHADKSYEIFLDGQLTFQGNYHWVRKPNIQLSDCNGDDIPEYTEFLGGVSMNTNGLTDPQGLIPKMIFLNGNNKIVGGDLNPCYDNSRYWNFQ